MKGKDKEICMCLTFSHLPFPIGQGSDNEEPAHNKMHNQTE